MKLAAKPRGGIENLGPAPVVILVRPQMGENVGAAARAMLNFGLIDLRLVAPAFGWPNAKAVAASSGAHEILNRMTIHARLTDAVDDLHHLFATTARPRGLNKDIVDARTAAARARLQMARGRRVGLIFGPERTGLENDELTLADALVTVPLNPAFPSLNLAQAVLLLGYEWHMSTAAEPRPETPAETPAAESPAGNPHAPPATKGDLDRLLDHLLTELDDTGFFRSEDRRQSLSHTIRTMFERRRMTRPEVQLVRGIVKDLVHGRRRRKGEEGQGG
ncbi:MAG: RNA methyltransferase [Geminicoccaceae bacterium]|nr:RNA methyltransferase [Geminicoccaceae bacterium]